MSILSQLEKQSQPIKILAGFILILVIGIFDLLTGYEFSFSLFYVIPISLLAWLINRRIAVIASIASACVWLWADVVSGNTYSHSLIPIWNTLIRLSFFIIITFLLSELRNVLQHEKELAHTDSLTGAVNSRFFFKLAQMEMDRLQRHEKPFTLVYVDLDNFKAVNDQFGHVTGDGVLCAVVAYAKNHLRKIDVIARLGGDEFVLLLPETNQESARVAVTKLQAGLTAEMQKNNWSITFSLGVLTCSAAPPTTSELVRMADKLMYAVKRGGKNSIRYAVYPD